MKLICYLLVASLTLSGCGFLARYVDESKIEQIAEDTTEVLVEEAAGLAGIDVDVQVDINPKISPKCHLCPLHCPKPEVLK